MEDFNVYVIHSGKPIEDIQKMLQDCGGYTYMGIIYKSFGKRSKKQETKKTIVFCSEETVRQLQNKYRVFQGNVAAYNWDSFPLPKEGESEGWDLHISGVPSDFTVNAAEAFVVDSLACILPQKEGDRENYQVTFAPRSRETGEIYGYGRIIFAPHVSKESIKLCKLILHNTPLRYQHSDKKRIVTCIWHKPPKEILPKEEGWEEDLEDRSLINVKRMQSISVQKVDSGTNTKGGLKRLGVSKLANDNIQ